MHDGGVNSPGQRHAGDRVRLARARISLNQQDFAARADVNPTTVSSLETGRRWPHPRSQLGITRALGWPDGELERIAREKDAEASPDATVTVLAEALDAFERSITGSDLPAEGKRLVVRLYRERGGREIMEQAVAELRELRRRGRA